MMNIKVLTDHFNPLLVWLLMQGKRTRARSLMNDDAHNGYDQRKTKYKCGTSGQTEDGEYTWTQPKTHITGVKSSLLKAGHLYSADI